MESAAAASAPAYAGPSNDMHMQPPGAFDDEPSSSRHFAIPASQVPKPMSTMPPPLQQMPLPLDSSTSTAKDGKSFGTRFLEECHDTDLPSPRLRSSRMFKGKGKDVVPIECEKKKPLNLLDLPVDILKDIVKEVTHTNDMTSLALCHSALHRLTIPHIYSRFDIVWPDTTTHTEQRSGVDALTFGLATLVMAEEIFGEAPGQRPDGQNRFNAGMKGKASDTAIRRRRGNHYAQFTKKFSLGNGPTDWVQEYLISKEGGKMLGTLVALAVARMRSLETFVWDMPTGILRDVWLALSSLSDRDDDRPCRLEKVWVRWHDNSSGESTSPVPPPPPTYQMHTFPPGNLTAAPSMPQATATAHPAALDRVERPSFSVLPPLKSLSVLDIDEIAYLDEMAVLIGRSLDKLRELRVGIARHAVARDFVTCWDGEGLEQVDHESPTVASSTIGERRLGGVLGVLTGFVSDMRKPKKTLSRRNRKRSRRPSLDLSPNAPPPPQANTPAPTTTESDVPIEASGALPSLTSLRDMLPDISTARPSIEPGPSALSPSLLRPDAVDSDPLVEMCSHASSPMRTPSLQPDDGQASPGLVVQSPLSPSYPVEHQEPPSEEQQAADGLDSDFEHHEYLDHTLKLENLELERIPLSIPVLQRALDWAHLTSLTLLHCGFHEQLWKTLRRTFAPIPKSPVYPSARRTPSSTPRKGGKSTMPPDVEMEYRLKLKKIHTNTVSPALIAFLKETLAPNSLETLFLQETRSYSSPVSVDHIYKGPLRRHRASLKRILIDSSEKGIDGQPVSSSRWRRWMVGREILAFMTSGKMPVLRELGVALDYRDWVSRYHSLNLPTDLLTPCQALLPPSPAFSAASPLHLYPFPGRPRPWQQPRPSRTRTSDCRHRRSPARSRALLHGHHEQVLRDPGESQGRRHLGSYRRPCAHRRARGRRR